MNTATTAAAADHIDPADTVGELVRRRPGRSRVFESVGIDYCCGGKRPLAEACAASGLEVGAVLDLLRRADAEGTAADDGPDPAAMALADLADHIEATHHAWLREELPRLDRITEKVHSTHAARDPRLHDVRRAFCALRDELIAHMAKEERVLFPMIRELERSSEAVSFHCGSIANPIRQMEAEHAAAGDALRIMRDATGGFTPSETACNTHRAMLEGLARLEQDMHAHVHKENNVLFPAAVRLEADRRRHRGGSA